MVVALLLLGLLQACAHPEHLACDDQRLIPGNNGTVMDMSVRTSTCTGACLDAPKLRFSVGGNVVDGTHVPKVGEEILVEVLNMPEGALRIVTALCKQGSFMNSSVSIVKAGCPSMIYTEETEPSLNETTMGYWTPSAGYTSGKIIFLLSFSTNHTVPVISVPFSLGAPLTFGEKIFPCSYQAPTPAPGPGSPSSAVVFSPLLGLVALIPLFLQ